MRGRNNEHAGIHPPEPRALKPGRRPPSGVSKTKSGAFVAIGLPAALCPASEPTPFRRGRFLFQNRASRGFRHKRVSGGSNLVRKPRSRPAPTRIGTSGTPFGMWLHTGGVAGRRRPHPQLRLCPPRAPAAILRPQRAGPRRTAPHVGRNSAQHDGLVSVNVVLYRPGGDRATQYQPRVAVEPVVYAAEHA